MKRRFARRARPIRATDIIFNARRLLGRPAAVTHEGVTVKNPRARHARVATVMYPCGVYTSKAVGSPADTSSHFGEGVSRTARPGLAHMTAATAIADSTPRVGFGQHVGPPRRAADRDAKCHVGRGIIRHASSTAGNPVLPCGFPLSPHRVLCAKGEC